MCLCSVWVCLDRAMHVCVRVCVCACVDARMSVCARERARVCVCERACTCASTHARGNRFISCATHNHQVPQSHCDLLLCCSLVETISIEGRDCAGWAKRGAVAAADTWYVDRQGVPCRYHEVVNKVLHNLTFVPSTFSTQPLDRELFQVPAYCQKKCPHPYPDPHWLSRCPRLLSSSKTSPFPSYPPPATPPPPSSHTHTFVHTHTHASARAHTRARCIFPLKNAVLWSYLLLHVIWMKWKFFDTRMHRVVCSN